MNWNDFWVAIGLVFIIEGMLPFLKPEAMRRLWQSMSDQDNKSLRLSGFFSMLIGLGLLYLVK